MEVMLGQYGCDDMAYLIEQSDKPGTVRVDRIIEHDGRVRTICRWRASTTESTRRRLYCAYRGASGTKATSKRCTTAQTFAGMAVK